MKNVLEIREGIVTALALSLRDTNCDMDESRARLGKYACFLDSFYDKFKELHGEFLSEYVEEHEYPSIFFSTLVEFLKSGKFQLSDDVYEVFEIPRS